MATPMPRRAVARAPRRHAITRTSQALDSYDVAILSALLANPRTSAAELAGTVHLSRTAVARRIATLLESGLIDKLQRSESYEEVGLGVRASIELATPMQTLKSVSGKLLERPEVLEITIMSGGTTLLLDVVAVDIPHLRHFICSIKTLGDTVTRIVFSKMRSPLSLRQRLHLLSDEGSLDGHAD